MGLKTEKALNDYNYNKTISDMEQNIKDAMGYQPNSTEISSIRSIANVDNEESDKIPKKHGYVPRLTVSFTDGTVVDLLDYSTIVQVEINLDYYVFPLISIRLDPPASLIPKLQFDDDLEIKFELLHNPITEMDTASMYDTLWNINLKKVKQESSPVMLDEFFYEETDAILRTEPIELKLIPTECLKANKSLFSGVYANCDMMQLLCLITEKFNYNSYIVNPDNIKKYDQIIFPPCNSFYAIEYLDQYYGLYDRGLKMFYGFGQNIIMPKNHFVENGLNKVKVAFSNDSAEGLDIYTWTQGGLETYGSDNYITITPNNVKVLDRRHYIKETLGTLVTTYSRDDDNYFEQAREYDYSANSTTNKVEKVKSYINQYNNSSKEKEYLLQSAYSRQLELLLNDVILPPDSWFKAFTINFDSENYNQFNGNYSMNGYYFRFSKLDNKNGASDFNVTTAIELVEV